VDMANTMLFNAPNNGWTHKYVHCGGVGGGGDVGCVEGLQVLQVHMGLDTTHTWQVGFQLFVKQGTTVAWCRSGHTCIIVGCPECCGDICCRS
jgi:hypothetical protein